MDKEQEAAIRSLERALGRCAKAGVALCGMDQDLIAYDAAVLEAGNENRGSGHDLYESQRRLNDAGESITVEDHGAYRESGGW